MDYKDHLRNNDVKFAISVLKERLEDLQYSKEFGHHLSPQFEKLQKEIEFLESAIKKIKEKF